MNFILQIGKKYCKKNYFQNYQRCPKTKKTIFCYEFKTFKSFIQIQRIKGKTSVNLLDKIENII